MRAAAVGKQLRNAGTGKPIKGHGYLWIGRPARHDGNCSPGRLQCLEDNGISGVLQVILIGLTIYSVYSSPSPVLTLENPGTRDQRIRESRAYCDLIKNQAFSLKLSDSIASNPPSLPSPSLLLHQRLLLADIYVSLLHFQLHQLHILDSILTSVLLWRHLAKPEPRLTQQSLHSKPLMG